MSTNAHILTSCDVQCSIGWQRTFFKTFIYINILISLLCQPNIILRLYGLTVHSKNDFVVFCYEYDIHCYEYDIHCYGYDIHCYEYDIHCYEYDIHCYEYDIHCFEYDIHCY